jgi:hypothetical protein
MTAKTLVTTSTGEPFQPVRLYYEIRNRNILLGRFKRLRCIVYDAKGDRWCWHYEQEAKSLEFQKPYSAIAKEFRPLVLGYFKFESDTLVSLNLRSIDRALKAAGFFREKVPHQAWQVTRVRLVNFLTAAPEEGTPDLTVEDFLDVDTVTIQNDDEFERKLEAINALYPDIESRRNALNQHLEQSLQKPLAPVEEFSTGLENEFDFDQFVMALRMRLIVAVQHWDGNTRFSRLDVFKMMADERDW